MKKLSALLLMGTALQAQAQVPSPAPAQNQAIAVTGATLHNGNGKVFLNSVLYFTGGKIDSIGSATAKIPAVYKVTNAAGKHIYPGLIAMATYAGLVEIDAVRATEDFAEVGQNIPNVRALPAFNTDSEILPTLKQNGTLLAQITPQGNNMVMGTSSAVQLDAWNWEDAAYKTDEGVHLRWPGVYRSNPAITDPEVLKSIAAAKAGRQKSIDELWTALQEAAHYSATGANKFNLKMRAFSGLFSGAKTWYIHTNGAKEMLESVQFAQKAGIKKIVIIGASEAGSIAGFLKEHNIPVVLGSPHRLPDTDGDDIDAPYKLPAELVKAGLTVALSFVDDNSKGAVRNLPFIAGTASAYGLNKEEALALVSYNPAKLLGIDKQTGSLAAGKDATFVISSGDLLDMRTNRISQAFIQGRNISLDGKQIRLYKKFSAKYGQSVAE